MLFKKNNTKKYPIEKAVLRKNNTKIILNSKETTVV